MTLDLTCHGRATSPVSSTTAAAVSSQDVSMPRMRIRSDAERLSSGCRGQRFDVRWPEDPALRDDAGNQMVRGDIERWIPHRGALRRQLGASKMRHFLGLPL